MTDNRERGQLNVRNFPETLKQRFKAHCAERGISMKDMLVKLMRRSVSEKRRFADRSP